MDAINWPLYLTAVVLLTLTPGPDMLYVISRGLAEGRRSGVVSAMGLTLGVLSHALLAAFGVSALLLASEMAFVALKLAGAAYLFYLGVKMLRAGGGFAVPADGAAPTGSAFWQGAVSALLNPKLALFFFAFLPQFVPAGSAAPVRDMLVLGITFAAVAIPIQAAFGFFAGSLSGWLRRTPQASGRVTKVAGALLVLLGVRLLFAQRS